jgi:hypothetical protein
MKTNSYLLLGLAAALAITPAAVADQFNFSFNGGGVSTSGTLWASPSSTPGTDQITNITGTFSDTNVGVSGAITGLHQPVSYVSDTSVGVAFTSGGLSYDDLFYPAGDSPAVCFDPVTHELTYPFSGGQFDIFGVAFDIAGPGGYVAELWSNGNIPGAGLIYAAGLANATGLVDNPNAGPDSGTPPGVFGSFSATATPEPGSSLLLGIGLVGMIALWTRKSKRHDSSEA